MPVEHSDSPKLFERGVVILSLDTEQIWGYLDLLNERQFRKQYPDTLGAHEKLLTCLSRAGISATWFVVGGMTLRGSDGALDHRMAGLPTDWTARIPRGGEAMSLWYRPSFVERLRAARPLQEIGSARFRLIVINNDHRSEVLHADPGVLNAFVAPVDALAAILVGNLPRIFQLAPDVLVLLVDHADHRVAKCKRVPLTLNRQAMGPSELISELRAFLAQALYRDG